MKILKLKLEQVELLKILLEKMLIVDAISKDDEYVSKNLKVCLNVLNKIKTTGTITLEVTK